MKNIVYILMFICSYWTGYGQEEPYVPTGENFTSSVSVPNSPEASALTSHGNVGASLFTGTPNISVPIGSIAGRELSIPISMSYDASGIKVSQLATWTGLGWNLQAGGVVNRVNVGQPDDAFQVAISYKPFYSNEVKNLMNKYPNEVGEFQALPNDDVNQYFTFKKKVNNGQYETQPDYYMFNAPGGLSGKFYIDYENNVGVCINDSTIKIIPSIDSYGGFKHLVSFKVINNNGIVYDFELQEHNRSSFVVMHGFPIAVEADNYLDYVSSWHLTKITSPTKNDVITYNYIANQDRWSNPQRYGLKESMKSCLEAYGTESNCEPSAVISGGVSKERYYDIDLVFLESIYVNSVKRAEFIPQNSNRMDLENSKALGEIRLYNISGDLVSSTSLLTSYFQENANPNETEARLKLDEVHTTSYGSINNSSSTQKYTFEYEGDGQIPDRLSLAQDWYGYYNNAQNNNTKGTLVPLINTDENFLDGANRYPNIQFAKIGTLNKITYPTGGSTQFEYGMHPVGHKYNELTVWDDVTQPFVGELLDGNPLECGGTNPYCYVDDACPGVAKGEVGSFQIGDGTNENIVKTFRVISQFSDNNTAIECQPWSVFVIYPTTNNTPSIEEFRTNSASRFYYREMLGSSQEFEVELPDGEYNYLIMNNSSQHTFQIQKAANSNYEPHVIYGGGLRVDKVRDFAVDNTLLSYKRYYYDDFSNVVNPDNDDFKKATSALVHEPLRFSEVINEHRRELPMDGFSCQLYDQYYRMLYRYSNNRNTAASNVVTYDFVTEIQYNTAPPFSAENGYTVHQYFNNRMYYENHPYPDLTVLSGQLRKQRVYDKNNNLEKVNENVYESIAVDGVAIGTSFTLVEVKDGTWSLYEANNGAGSYYKYNQTQALRIPNPDHEGLFCTEVPLLGDLGVVNEGFPVSVHSKNNFYLYPVWNRLKFSKSKIYFENEFIENRTDYFYKDNGHHQVTRTETKNSKDELIVTNVTYPQDVPFFSDELAALINTNRINVPVNRSLTVNGKTTSIRNSFDIVNGVVLPKIVTTEKLGIETIAMVIDRYDDNSNVLQTSKRVGTNDNLSSMKTAYIWGYDGHYPVAKIDNASYAQATTANLGLDMSLILNPPSDTVLRNEINKIRQALPNAMVTTYTYKPDVGVTSMVSPSNQIQYFEYDAPQRLVRIKDNDFKPVNSFKYNYKTND